MHINDLLWLAGILEGDGCFSPIKRNTGSSRPAISFCSIDEDTTNKVCSLMGSRIYVEDRKSKRKNENTIYKTTFSSSKARRLCSALLPYMGSRRSQKITDIFSDYQSRVLTVNTKRDLKDLKSLQKDRASMSYRQLSAKYGFSHEAIRKFLLGITFQSSPAEERLLIENEEHKDQVHWIAGLLEAEGSFMSGTPSRPNAPIISIQMTDKDVIEKYSKHMGCSFASWQRPSTETSHYKKVYLCKIRGARAREWMAKLLPLMSRRRQTQIKKALASYDPSVKNKAVIARRKLTDQDVKDIKRKIKTSSLRSVASEYGVHHETLRYRLGRCPAHKTQRPA